MASRFRLNRRGVSDVLRYQTAEAVNGLAEKIAAEVRKDVPEDVDVEVQHYSTDRAAASVAIADPRGMALQAKHGVLTKAAAATGLEVKAK